MTFVVGVLPKRGGAVRAVFVQRVEKDVEGGELLFVVVVVVRDAGHGFEAGVGGRHAFAHHFDDGVAAGDFDVFFAFPCGAGGADFVIDAAARADDGGIAHAAGNLPGEAGGRGGGGDVALFVDGHAGNRARGRMGDDALRVGEQRLIFGRVAEKRGHLFFPLGAVDAGPPIEGRRGLPGEPDFAGVLGEEIHFLETFVDREAARAIADNHDVIGALHHGFGEARDVFDAAHARDGAGAVRGAVHDAGVQLDFALFVGEAAVANGVVVGVVFDDGDGGHDGVEGVATFFEDVHAAAERLHSVGAGDDERALALRGGRCGAGAVACGGCGRGACE